MDAGGLDADGFFSCECKEDFDVVDHQIEHHVDVEAAGREDAEAMDLKEERKCDGFFECGDGRVKSFEMTHLQDALVLGSKAHQMLSAGEIERNWLLYQDVEARFEQFASNLGMGNGWDSNNAGLRGLGESFQRVKGWYAELGGSCRCRCRISIIEASERCTG